MQVIDVCALDISQLLARAESLRASGNEFYSCGKLHAALRHYQAVLGMLFSEPRLFLHARCEGGHRQVAAELRLGCTLNTAACFNKLSIWQDSIKACTQVPLPLLHLVNLAISFKPSRTCCVLRYLVSRTRTSCRELTCHTPSSLDNFMCLCCMTPCWESLRKVRPANTMSLLQQCINFQNSYHLQTQASECGPSSTASCQGLQLLHRSSSGSRAMQRHCTDVLKRTFKLVKTRLQYLISSKL